jgi:chitodextrinase
MSSKTGRIKKFRVKKDKTSILAGVSAILFVVTIGVHILFGTHAQVVSTPTIGDLCGVTSPGDVEEPTAALLSPTTAISHIIVPTSGIGMSTFHLVNSGGTEEAYVLGDNNSKRTIYIYNLGTGALIGSFPVAISGNSADTFALDPQGNVYVIDSNNTQDLYKYNSTGAVIWKVSTPGGSGGAYGYTNQSGTFLIAAQPPNSTKGSPVYNQTGTSLVFNTSGVSQGTNNMNISGDTEQDPTTGDVLSTSGSMFRVYTNAGNLKFQMGTDLGPNTPGPFHFYIQAGAVENPKGGYYIADSGHGMESYDASGGYQGEAIDFQENNGANNTIGFQPGHSVIYNGNLYYILNGGINSFDSNNNKQGIYKISLGNLNADINYPQGSTGHLGIGAGMSTTQSNNFFPSGTPPSVNMTFYPWWASQASNFTVKYTVRSIPQVIANTTMTPISFGLGSYLSSNATSPVSIPLNLASANSVGAYEISARIYNNANPTVAVGSDCIDYSVGASGEAYSPPTINKNSGNLQAVEVAHELGQNYVRGGNEGDLIDACLPGVTNPTSSTQISCPASLDSDISAAAALANQYGMTFNLEIAATGGSLDTNLVSSGQWGRLVGQLVAHYPEVKNWEVWNEINNDGGNYGNGAWDATNVYEPAYIAMKDAEPSDNLIGGSSLGVSVSYWQSVGGAGGFKDMNAIDIHPYVDFNKSFEEQGFVIPPQDAATSEKNLGNIDQLVKVVSDTKDYAFNSGVSSLPIYDSEFGMWNSGPISYYNQGSKQVRATILQNSDGITNIAVFQNTGCYEVSGSAWGTVGCGYDGGDAPAAAAEATLDHMLDGPTVPGNRKFIQWLPTGVPHTYAAEYGPSVTDSGNKVVLWADDFDVNVVPRLSGGGNIAVTSQFGASSTVSAGAAMTINGQVQYLEVPAGQSLSIGSQETFGASQTLATAGATATASSTANCSQLNPSNVLNGVDDLSNEGRCNSAAFWAQSPSDTNPSLTVTLKNPQNIDRVFLASTGIDSAVDGLRNFDVQVSSSVGGSFTTVGSVTNAFFERNHLVTFNPQTVAQVRIANMTPNYTGYGNGLQPTWWPTDTASLTDPTQPWYGQDDIMEVDAFDAGNGIKTSTPPAAPTGLSAKANGSTSVGLSWSASTDSGGPGVAGYNILRNGTKIGSSTSTTYTDNSVNAATTYNYAVEAFDSGNPSLLSTASASVSVITPNAADTTPPSVPIGLVASDAATPKVVSIAWKASTDNTGGSGLAGYHILRDGVDIGDTNSTTTTYQDNSVSPSTTYSYAVEAYDNAGNISAPSTAISITTPANPVTPPPSAPTNVSATAVNSNQVSLTWVASKDSGGPGIAGYYVIRNGVTQATIGSNSGTVTIPTSYVDRAVLPSTKYAYTVEAFDKSSPSLVSAPSSTTTVETPSSPDTTPPTAPSSLIATAVSSSQINLAWKASTDNIGVKDYEVFRSGVLAPIVVTQATSYGDAGLSPSTTYSYHVIAQDSSGNNSAPSSTVSATTQPQVQTNLVTIYGVVRDASTKKPMAGVFVHSGNAGTANGQAQSTTNSAGEYLLSKIIPNKKHNYYYTAPKYTAIHLLKSYAPGKYQINEVLSPRVRK